MPVSQIPIENIYFLLAYAWDKLDEAERVPVALDGETDLLDLFAKILTGAARVLLKRGIDKNYVLQTAEIAGIKGKLELAATIKSNSLLRQRTVCSFDEFSGDTLINRILIATFNRLLKTTNLNQDLKRDIRFLRTMFGEISALKLDAARFKQVWLNRNNRFYAFVLNVCELVYRSTLPSETAGEFVFTDFTRDAAQMSRLFEAFARSFYRRETAFDVRRETIEWQFLSENNEDLNFLPQMQTDITLENANRKVIIDAKFYSETMTLRFDREKIKSANLYQLFSYLINQRRSGEPKTLTAAGILLYPTIEKEYDLQFDFESHRIYVKTVNLNQHWQCIAERLKEIVRTV